VLVFQAKGNAEKVRVSGDWNAASRQRTGPIHPPITHPLLFGKLQALLDKADLRLTPDAQVYLNDHKEALNSFPHATSLWNNLVGA
jgi:hypothetical protein